MFYRGIWIVLLVSCASSVWARDLNPDLLYGCNAKESQIKLGAVVSEKEDELKKSGYIVERVTSYDLIEYAPEDKKGNVYRTGSKMLKRKCGQFTVVIRGGFLNFNPLGELGAIEHPSIDILIGKKMIAKNIAIGECFSAFDLYSTSSRCPDDWGTEVTVLPGFPESNKSVNLYLKHSFEEYRTIP